MKTQTGSDTEFNEFMLSDIDSDELPDNIGADKETRPLTARRMIEHRLEQKRLKEQIDTWGLDDEYPDIDLEH